MPSLLRKTRVTRMPSVVARAWSLSPDARKKMVRKITDTLQKHMPPTTPEGMNDLKKIALRFEEKIYNAAAVQQDYLRKISLKMLSLETRNQVPGGNAPGSSQKPLDPGTADSTMKPGNHSKWSLSSDVRQKMVNKIMDTLQKHATLIAPEDMNKLKTTVLRFEEKIYNASADLQEYLRKISLKMLSLERGSQVHGGNAENVVKCL